MSAALHLKKAGDEPLETGDGQQRRGRMVRGNRHRLRDPARRRDVPPSPAPRPSLVDRRGRHLPRRSWATAARPGGWPTPRRPIATAGSTCRSTRRSIAARVAGISHGFLAFDDTGSEWTRNGETFTFRLFPNRFVYSRDQNRASAPYFTIELGPEDRRPPAAPTGLRLEPGTALLPAGEALVSWITPRDAGPAGTLGFFVTLDGTPLPRELIPLAGVAGARVEMHLRDLKLAARPEHKLSVRAVDAAGNRGPEATAAIRLSNRVPAHLPQLKPGRRARPLAAAALPRLAGADVAILDELDKVHPIDRRADSRPARRLPGRQSSLGCRRSPRSRSRRLGTSSSRFRSCCAAISPPERSSPSWFSTGRPARRSRSRSAAITPVPSRRGPMPDPIVPLSFAADSRAGDQEPKPSRRDLYPARAAAGRISRHADAERCPAAAEVLDRDDRDTLRLAGLAAGLGLSPCPIISASCRR